MFKNLFRRVNIVTGHYGSGKTNLALNLALMLAGEGRQTCIVDLDIVNPYFRTNDQRALLEQHGIRVIAPIYANTNLDIPALPAEINAVFDDKKYTILLDVGGDDAGAAALGRYADEILRENDYRHFYVVNFRRPLTGSPEQAVGILREIEAAGRVKADAIINNTNLAVDTGRQTVQESIEKTDRLCRLTGLPLAFTSVRDDLAPALQKEAPFVLPVKIFIHVPWTD